MNKQPRHLLGFAQSDQFSSESKIDQQQQEVLIHNKKLNHRVQQNDRKQQTLRGVFLQYFKSTLFTFSAVAVLIGLAIGLYYLQEEIRQRKFKNQIIQKTLFVGVDHQNQQGNYVPLDKYYFSSSIKQMLLKSDVRYMFNPEKNTANIAINQFMRAVIRLQLVHNINNKGEINITKLSPFDRSTQQKQQAIRNILHEQQTYFQSLYGINKYRNRQLPFCLVVASYKNAETRLYLRNLDSIFMQDYENYHVVYIDDASDDQTGESVRKYLKEKKIQSQKIDVIINQRNQKALYNIYHGIHKYCKDGQIVALIDGDDSLIGTKVLMTLNAVYQQKRAAMIYTNFVKILQEDVATFGFGSQVSPTFYFEGGLRKSPIQLAGTHLMTFFSDVFKKIAMKDLCYQNGTFYEYAYDRAIITPLVQMAFPRVHYLPEFMYEYRNDTGLNDGTDDWRRVSAIIISKQPYQMLGDFSFVDKRIDEWNKMNMQSEAIPKEKKLKTQT